MVYSRSSGAQNFLIPCRRRSSTYNSSFSHTPKFQPALWISDLPSQPPRLWKPILCKNLSVHTACWFCFSGWTLTNILLHQTWWVRHTCGLIPRLHIISEKYETHPLVLCPGHHDLDHMCQTCPNRAEYICPYYPCHIQDKVKPGFWAILPLVGF